MRLTWARIALSTLIAATMIAPAFAQNDLDLSGSWKQDNDRCRPKRKGDVTLRIGLRDNELKVETTRLRDSVDSRRTTQIYTLDGKVSVSTGADGDEFHTSVIRKDGSLVFSIEEHEDARILRSRETWSLVDNGTTIEKIRERSDGQKQFLFFRRGQ